MNLSKNYSSGFSLVEMAVVLVIIGLLLAVLLTPLSVQMEQASYKETQNELKESREALIGYALTHVAADGKPYLPCPDTDDDGFENRSGDGSCVNAQGDFPWATLGLGHQDGWNNGYIYRVAMNFSDSSAGFSLNSMGSISIMDAAGGKVIATSTPAVVLSKGKNGLGAGADETENTDGDEIFVSHTQVNLSDNAFDDIVVWVPFAILFNRLVSAGRLP